MITDKELSDLRKLENKYHTLLSFIKDDIKRVKDNIINAQERIDKAILDSNYNDQSYLCGRKFALELTLSNLESSLFVVEQI